MKIELCEVIFSFKDALRLGQVCMRGVVAAAFLRAAADAHTNQVRREGVQIVILATTRKKPMILGNRNR